MSKIKELSRYNGTSWETPVPLGADASNIDVSLSGGGTQDLQTVIDNKVDTTGDGSTTTVTNLSNYDLDTDETSKVLIKDGQGGTVDEEAAQVTAVDSNSQVTLWSKFNRFRKRVENKFGDYFATANIRTAYQTTGANDDVYSTSLLNSYFANVIGYTGTSAPTAGSVASQLSSLNSKSVKFNPRVQSISGTIPLNTKKLSITANPASGYTFLTWIDAATSGWIGSVYIEWLTSKSTTLWAPAAPTGTQSGDIAAWFLCYKYTSS